MGLIDYKKLPVVKSFGNLKRSDRVYSPRYGLGTVIYFYHDQVVFGFGNYRKRLSEGEEDLREVPNNWLKKKTSRVIVNIGGQNMSLAAFKRKRSLEKRTAKLLSNILLTHI